MKPFSAWPRWVQLLVGLSVVLATLLAGIALEYRAMAPHTAGKSPLAQQFEAKPSAWLQLGTAAALGNSSST